MRTIGVDLGGTKIQTIAVAQSGDDKSPADGTYSPEESLDEIKALGRLKDRYRVTASARVLTPTGGPDDVADAIADTVNAVGVDAAGVGIGFAGLVDPVTGTVTHGTNIANFPDGTPIAKLVQDRVGIPVYLDNDVNVAVFGEFRLGAGRGSSDMAGVWVGTGVGGGLVLGSKLRHGPHGWAAEIGHMVIKMGGRKPFGGPQGSLEAYAGRNSMQKEARRLQKKGKKTQLFKIMKKKGKDKLTSGVFLKAVNRGDKVAKKLMDDNVQALGVGIASLVNILDLDAIVLGGGVTESFGEDYAARIKEEMKKSLIAPDFVPDVSEATLGDFSGALGAALIVEENLQEIK